MKISLKFVIIIFISCAVFHQSCKSDKSSNEPQILKQKTAVDQFKGSTYNKGEREEMAWESAELSNLELDTSVTIKKDSIVPSKPVENIKSVKPKKPRARKKKKRSKIVFNELEYDFGTITEGDTVNYKFEFKNMGEVPLEVQSANASCGCTRPSFPFIAIESGKMGYIGVQYISINKSGSQKPEIIVSSNGSDKPITLFLKGIVESKPEIQNPEVLDSSLLDTLSEKGY